MIDSRVLDTLSLSPEEFRLIRERLGREPNLVELGMFGALWSEHCAYKHSKPLLQSLPTQGPQVIQGPGENAGVVDIGEGLAVVFKMESHNHPSAIEPFQGAATGVGGIIRDVFTMGARPIALLDSLRFGPLTRRRNRYLFGQVVAGVGNYGNCLGVPTVGGEVCFEEGYEETPLVNVMAVGLLQQEHLMRAGAKGEGHALLLVGADTGRDGILGAAFASVTLGDDAMERRPAVQVGNPFLEKLLIEACLDVVHQGLAVAVQDLGAAGIAAAVVESAAKGRVGAEVDLLEVSRREEGMTPYEVVLSESQERMLVIARREDVEAVKAVFRRWDLHSDVIGRLTGDGKIRILEGDRAVAELPVEVLSNPPMYRLTGIPGEELNRRRAFDPEHLPEPTDYGATLLQLMAAPNIASKEWVYRQYDHMNLTNTMLGPGASDAAVLRIKGTRRAIALTSDGNGRYGLLDPYLGGAIAVAEAARNVSCAGGEPLALTDCLNFGNPERAEIYYQLERAIQGMSEACRVLDIPVVSGNVSLYNERADHVVWPTPVVGMVGLLPEAELRVQLAFQRVGDVVGLLGPLREELGGSEYVKWATGQVAGKPPSLDLALERRVQRCCRTAIQRGYFHSAHDCSDGGLAVAIAEACLGQGLGARLRIPASVSRLDAFLFGESQSRIVVSLSAEQWGALERLAEELGVPLTKLGEVGGDELAFEGVVALPLKLLDRAWRGSLPQVMEGGYGG